MSDALTAGLLNDMKVHRGRAASRARLQQARLHKALYKPRCASASGTVRRQALRLP